MIAFQKHMSHAGVRQSFNNSRPLQTIAEGNNSDSEMTDRADPRIKQWEDIYKPVKPGADEWHSSTSESSVGRDEGSESSKMDHSKLIHVGPRTR